MPTYTVHEPPPRNDEAASDPQRFAFVRDGFYFWAFVLAPLWLLVRQQWVALLIYFIVNAALGIIFAFAAINATAQTCVHLAIALMVGLEAGSIQRWTLAKRGWKTLGFVVGEDPEMAERRFYAEWAKGRDSERDRRKDAAPAAPAPLQYSTPVRRGPPSGSDVIGLFPEPGAHR